MRRSSHKKIFGSSLAKDERANKTLQSCDLWEDLLWPKMSTPKISARACKSKRFANPQKITLPLQFYSCIYKDRSWHLRDLCNGMQMSLWVYEFMRTFEKFLHGKDERSSGRCGFCVKLLKSQLYSHSIRICSLKVTCGEVAVDAAFACKLIRKCIWVCTQKPLICVWVCTQTPHLLRLLHMSPSNYLFYMLWL